MEPVSLISILLSIFTIGFVTWRELQIEEALPAVVYSKWYDP